MKRVVLMIIPALICGMLITSCGSHEKLNDDDDDVITLSDGSTLHLENYQWLKKLIESSKTDKTGNYMGCIWLEKFKGQEIFVTNMMLGSGGIMHWFFDSSGNHFASKESNICTACNFVGNHHVFFEDWNWEGFSLKLDNLVYSPFPFPCK